ncbi:hypothetical protein H6P81_018220 [Aristolochia fimbriata]|uniref:Geranylgeranyl transferase type II subunit beta n=1 Tax=Aristolochia fimbriata TaxID=158543 RepID=A0AAV7E3K8_ARIFI|nr:hypothetical protein H6P81_018220 [Aristolochia fimbriata]
MGELAIDKHVQYILDVEKKRDFETLLMEHIRMNGAYWGLTTLYLLGKLEKVDQDAVVEWMMKCQHDCGGFGGSIGHDPHVLYTLSAVQVLVLFNKLDMLDAEKVSNSYRMKMDLLQVTYGEKLIPGFLIVQFVV